MVKIYFKFGFWKTDANILGGNVTKKIYVVTLMMIYYSRQGLYIHAENEPAVKRNEAILNDLPGKFYTIEANEKFPDNSKYPLATIQAAQNQK